MRSHSKDVFFLFGIQALADCGKKELKKENSNECGGSTAEGGVTGDDFEWDFWDVSNQQGFTMTIVS